MWDARYSEARLDPNYEMRPWEHSFGREANELRHALGLENALDGAHMRLHRIGEQTYLSIRRMAGAQEPLLGRESTFVEHAVASRVREFAAGRAAAREALHALGCGRCEIPGGLAGEPVWPEGVCGSISHTNDVAVALVSLKSAHESVGVDIDDDRPIGNRAASLVTWRRETEFLVRLGICSDTPSAENFAFSSKEAIFKCQYPLTQQRSLDFQQVRLIQPVGHSVAGLLSVSGWRVTALVAAVLGRITIQTRVIDGQRIVAALIPTML